jgi:alpha-glucosidase
MIQPLWAVFPDDPRAWADGEEHLLGRDLLACPVVEPGVSAREIYLPAGADWHEVWSGSRHAGGRSVRVEAALDGPPPLFVRAGAGMLVDLAPQGFRPGPVRLGAWLFPPAGDGAFDWSAHVAADDAAEVGDPPLWRVRGEAVGDTLRLAVSWSGEPGPRLEISLPAQERRSVRIEGPADVRRGAPYDPAGAIPTP